MNETVLVTGGCGFIGTWVVRELKRCGALPVVLDHQPPPSRWDTILGKPLTGVVTAEGSLTDRGQMVELLDSYEVTHIIQLAALLTPACQADPWAGFQVNVQGSMALFDAARMVGRVQGISLASSCAVYGPSSGTETETFYGAFKSSVDAIARQYHRHFGIASVAVRPHVVYGPERTVGLTAGPSLACRAAALGEEFTINYRGIIGYDYAEDAARAFVRTALEPPGGSVIVDLPSHRVTTEEFVELIGAAAPESRGKIHVDGPAIPDNIPAAPNYIGNLYSDWQTTPLAEGIQRTIDFYRNGGVKP